MKFVVTGAAGFVGAYLTRALLSEHNEVVAVDNYIRGVPSRLSSHPNLTISQADVRDAEALTKVMVGADAVIHLAAVNGTENFYNRPELVLDVGVRGILAVVEACKRARVYDLVVASSAEVYQTPAAVPTNESVEMRIPDSLNPRYSYGGSKLISELIAFNYGLDHFRKVQVFRPHNVYGPDMGWKHVIPQLIMRATSEHAKGSRDLVIQGDGMETRAFCYVDDIVNGIKIMYSAGDSRQIYNIGSMEEVSIRTLTALVLNQLDLDMNIISGEAAIGGTPRRCPDISKLASLGYKPSTQLADGIRKTVKWYRSNPEPLEVGLL